MKNKLIQIQGTQSKHINRVKLLSREKKTLAQLLTTTDII